LEKVLQDAGVKITSVASAVWSASSRAMIEAMIGGERDPLVLASLAKSRMRSKIPELQEALPGTFGAHHSAVCRQIIDHIDFLDRSIATLSTEITARLLPFEGAVTIITSMTGIKTRTAEVIVAEIGTDMARFPTPGQLCAWGGVAPASHESAGKHRPAGTRRGNPWLRRTLLEAAHAAVRTRGSYYHAQHARIAKHRGSNKAIVAVANSMLSTLWHLLTNGQLYDDPGADYFEQRHDPAVEAKRLARRIEALGYDVNLTQKAA
jgi:transposase